MDVGWVVFIVGGIAGLSAGLIRLAFWLRAIDRKLDVVIKHLGAGGHERAQFDRVRTILGDTPFKNKVPAIKAYRDMTGAKLHEAKLVVDDLAAEMAAQRQADW